ncbi:MAG: hypothetical protein K2X93_21840 [Candidatus Obscuribacterales bacterium]|nr:hypothetical protein [Candidatus Obscuribacterales bacterium]
MPQKKANSSRNPEELDMSPPQDGALDNINKLDNVDSDIVHVRRVVAGNPNTPLSVLSRLANDECEIIRRSVAENPKTPKEMLQSLAKDASSEVRLAVAENPHTPSDILVVLAADSAVDVRYGVAENPHMPEGILLKLSKDENPYVRCRALKTLQMLAPDVQTRLAFMMQGPLDL